MWAYAYTIDISGNKAGYFVTHSALESEIHHGEKMLGYQCNRVQRRREIRICETSRQDNNVFTSGATAVAGSSTEQSQGVMRSSTDTESVRFMGLGPEVK